MALKFQEDWYSSLHPLSATLRQQLEKVPYTQLFGYKWYPCDVELMDGRRFERVFLIDGARYRRIGWVDDKRMCDLKVPMVRISEATGRLPERWRSILENAGESGMGYVVCSIKFGDGTEKPYLLQDMIDFPEMPNGKTYSDIVDICLHTPRKATEPRLGSKDYKYIYYRESN